MIDLPWWPPLEPMGDEHAAELILAIKPHAHRAVEATTTWLLEHSPDAPPRPHAATRTMIARMKLDPHMRGIPIGNVSIPGASGKPIIVGISVTRAGSLAITVPTADGSGSRWTPHEGDSLRSLGTPPRSASAGVIQRPQAGRRNVGEKQPRLRVSLFCCQASVSDVSPAAPRPRSCNSWAVLIASQTLITLHA